MKRLLPLPSSAMPLLPLLLLPLLLPHPPLAASETYEGTYTPISYTIPYRQEECLYERIDKAGEHLTASVFVVEGEEMKAAVSLEGPIAPPSVSERDDGGDESKMGMKLQQFLQRYAREGTAMFQGGEGYEKGIHSVKIEKMLDFEADPDEADFEYDDYEEDGGEKPDSPQDDETVRREKLKRQVDREADLNDDYIRAQMQAEMGMMRRRLSGDDFVNLQMDEEAHAVKDKRTGAGGRNAERLLPGEPWEHTVYVQSPGWYRLCVRAKVQTIWVEMELRKSSLYGKVNKETGHVPSFESLEIHREIRELYEKEKDPEIPEGAIKDEDLKVTRDQLRILERVYQEIIAKQLEERRVWNWRTLKNQHSHSHMVLGNLLETVMYMVITGFQIYTIRKWFGAGPALGR
mmetsp:Transcript_15659/g.32933  ORF Transcript_15659/g.32933 Transcript_15659/m.32933 type:complete len:404 (-) Transcript_15659:185-1396(-)|eukprot:CAMPEP_0171341376 /NCGR_PEP_ID=MMETSP0878-20121228/10151_1 /TAXON_ID=67004 /ORGANISM="Thalassiosira weissflogii, Strain CCMP1336" /LENGTH=403 /DNA_ID=CAMNT_0011843601 /DNA_START=238 /DNA_END=1449 /DNA_ORIENTATION=-